MTREEADGMLKALYESLGENAMGDKTYILFNTAEGVANLSFVFDGERKVLRCYAEVWKPEPGPPSVEELEAFREEEKRGTRTGNGRVEYVVDTQGLYLMRVYERVVAGKAFADDMRQLGEAAEHWRSDAVFDRVLARARAKKAASARQ